MKANWKFALLCAATIAFIGCKPQNQPEDPQGGDDEDPVFASKVKVSDNSIAEWDNLPAEYVASAECPDDGVSLGLKSLKVYADQVYINILFEFDPEELLGTAWVPLHILLNTDNSDATGGYGAYFTDANEDVLLETAFMCDGVSYDYNPAVFKYWGVGGPTEWDDSWFEPGVTAGAENNWGAYIAEGASKIGKSQIVDGKYVEIQLVRELIPCDWAPWADKFGIGLQLIGGDEGWSNIGYLPQVAPTEANPNGFTEKLTVTIDMAE